MYKIKLNKKYTLNKLLNKTKKRIGNKNFFNWGIYKNNSKVCKRTFNNFKKFMQKK